MFKFSDRRPLLVFNSLGLAARISDIIQILIHDLFILKTVNWLTPFIFETYCKLLLDKKAAIH